MSKHGQLNTKDLPLKSAFLLLLLLFSFYLRARETSTVRLTVLVPQGTAAGTTDRITFTSYGGDTSTFAVSLRVVSSIDAQVSV